MIDLKTTSRTYRVHDESGHEFELVTAYDAETGWNATVYVGGFGMATEQAAIDKALHAAERLLAAAKEAP